MSEVNPDKPCPFCGNATIKTTVDDGCHWGSCPKCSATGPTEFLRSDVGSPGWNTRPDYDAAQTELSGYRAANMVLRDELATERLRADTAVTDANDAERKLAALREELAGANRRLGACINQIEEQQQRLTAAEQRNLVLLGLLEEALGSVYVEARRAETPIASRMHTGLADRIEAALKPTESGASAAPTKPKCHWSCTGCNICGSAGHGNSWS